MMKRFLLVFAVIVLALPTFAQKSAAQIAGEKLREKWMNQKAPEFVVEKWLTKEPKMKGKFILVDFWGPSCGPCRKLIPELNEWSKLFKKDLLVIGVAPNKEESVRKMKEPVIEYFSAIDTQQRMSKIYGLKFYPMAVLIDPDGIVRWIGYPSTEDFTKEFVKKTIDEYTNQKKK